MLVRWHRSILALSALALASCGSKGEGREGPAPQRSAPTALASSAQAASPTSSGTAGASSAVPPAAPGASPRVFALETPGPALLSVRDGGLFQIDEGKLTKLSDEAPRDMTAGPDGVVYTDRGKAVRGGVIEDLPTGMYAMFATAKDGALWSLELERSVAKLVGSGKDRTWQKEAVPAGKDTLMYIEVDAGGQPVVASRDTVYAKRGGQWEVTPASKLLPDAPAEGVSIDGLVRVRDVVQVLTSHGAVGLDGKKLELPGHQCSGSLYERIAQVSAAGELAARCYRAALILDRSGKGTKLLPGAAMPKAEEVTAVAIDGQGRRWVGTDAGLAILAPDGKPLQRWEVGSLPGEVQSIVTLGAGPTLPVSTNPPVKGNVKARLLLNGSPAKRVEVEVCGHPRFLSYGKTPCAGQAAVISAKTDDAGVFELVGVPRGNYGFTMKDAKGWSILSGLGAPACCTAVTSGGQLDLGDLRVEASK